MRKVEEDVESLLDRFSKKLPIFSDGRIDYSHADIAPVITIFIVHINKMLLLKRSSKVNTYKEKWNTVAGYLDDTNQSLFEKILEELHEEVRIEKDQISSYGFGSTYQFTDEDNIKTWIVHPSLVTLSKKPVIKLNWEHTEYRWITADELKNFDTVPNLKKSMKRAMKLAYDT